MAEIQNIIQQGTEAKVIITIDDFDMDENTFKVQLIYGYRRTVMEIDKAQMQQGDGVWFFVFDTADMVGRIVARCTYNVPDMDASGGIREKVDEQFLCFVAPVPHPECVCIPIDTEEHKVHYQFTDESGIADKYQYLETSEGDKLITIDNMYIMVLKEAQEAQEAQE